MGTKVEWVQHWLAARGAKQLKSPMNFAIAGAGFSGAVIARELAEAGHHVTVYESRNHVAGNCHTQRDERTGVLEHRFGPHIFHTDNEAVWQYVNRFGEFAPYINRVKTLSAGRVYSLPVNLHTINQFFGENFSPDQARKYISTLADDDIAEPVSFEQQALKFVGRELYEAFFRGYTRKQWGVNPQELPASILKRLPLRFDYNDNYFSHRHQGIPVQGYTGLVEAVLDHDQITLELGSPFDPAAAANYDHVFYTGPIDAWFAYCHGRLGYRTLDFTREVHSGDYQGCAVMNYADEDVPYTRISEHKHFAPWESHDETVIYKEYSRPCEAGDTPYYPIRLVEEKTLLQSYLTLVREQAGVSFVGRLGTYRYLDMDVTIAEALDASRIALGAISQDKAIPPIFVDPGQ